jgi:hypothetical protein
VVFSIMKFFIPAERRGEAVDMLRTMQERLLISTDYIGSWIVERDHPCPHVLYAEQWKTEEAVYEHIRSSLYRRVLAAMELSCRAPEVSFYFVSHTKGMELIQALRLPPQQAVKAS